MHPTNRLLLGGFLTLAIVMGVGRFYYTPLLPLMQRDYGFDAGAAGVIAGVNFAGYLAGSLLVMLVPAGKPRLAAFRIGLLASIASTLLMGAVEGFWPWSVLRLISGAASAFSMICAASIVAEALGRIGAESRLAWLFGGVGSGIAISGLLVHFAEPFLSSAGLWIAAGLLCAALAPFALASTADRDLPPHDVRVRRPKRTPRPLAFWPLFVNYTLEGFGYSIFATFIVAVIKTRPGLEGFGDWVWIFVGLAGLPSCLFWGRMAERFGYAAALAVAYAAQIVGVLLPAVTTSGALALFAAILFGGTFIGITFLTMPLGRHGLGGKGFAMLTAGFGLGQMLGPVFAGLLVTDRGGYETALSGSAVVLIVALAVLLWAMRMPRTAA